MGRTTEQVEVFSIIGIELSTHRAAAIPSHSNTRNDLENEKFEILHDFGREQVH